MNKREDTFYRFVGQKIKDYRSQLNLNQSVLASKLGLSRTSMVNIEQGRQHPSLYMMWQIAECLQTELINFFPKEENLVSGMNIDIDKLKSQENVDSSVIDFLQTLKRN